MSVRRNYAHRTPKMKPLKFARNQILKLASKARYALSQPKLRVFTHKEVPYFCQWESKELAAKILSGEIKTETDPKWRESGAASPEEYALWSWNVCGMTCLKMILAAITGMTVPLTTLAKKCAKYGGYKVNGKQIDGLYYKPFVPFVKKEYGLTATVKPIMTIEDIIASLSKKNFVIASVSPDIRSPQSQPTYKGGHLVLMLGYNLDKQVFCLHNPSGNTPESQEYAEVSFEQFRKFFDEKGIVIHP